MQILSSSHINELIYNYKNVEIKKRLSSIQTKKNNFSTLSKTLSEISTKVTTLLSSLSNLKSTSTSSIFNAKTATSSNSELVTASAENSASIGSYEIAVSQLAKNDMVISSDLDSSAVLGLTGKHTFTINTGDGSNPDYTSTVTLELDGTETNLSLLEKISTAINTDYAGVSSTVQSASADYSGGESSFIINVGGTEYTINTVGGGTYEELIDELVEKINSTAKGVTAVKISDDPDTGDVKLSLTATNTKDYLTISHEGGFDLVSHLGIDIEKEISASAVLSASSFTPSSGKAQLSITSKNSGLDFRIKNIADETGSQILSQLGLNLGTSRPSFDQTASPDTAGFVCADITSEGNKLNSKFTFNSIQIQNSSNSVNDLVTGVTFNLKSVMDDSVSNVNINIQNDNTAIRDEVNDFIKKFNELYLLLKDKTKSTESSRGVLRGDSTTQSLLNTLRAVGYSTYGDETNEFQFLSQIGIKFDANTGLSISDSNLFDEKVNFNTNSVINLFNSTDNGLATIFHNSLNNFAGADGYLSLSKTSYDNSVKYFTDRIDSITTSIDKSADILRKRYQMLQSQYAALLSNQSFFSSGVTTDNYG